MYGLADKSRGGKKCRQKMRGGTGHRSASAHNVADLLGPDAGWAVHGGASASARCRQGMCWAASARRSASSVSDFVATAYRS